MSGNHQTQQSTRTRTTAGLALMVFLGVAAFFLITEHTAHVFGALPYLLLLLCPLMHIFMHGGHRGHGKNSRRMGVNDRSGDQHQHHHYQSQTVWPAVMADEAVTFQDTEANSNTVQENTLVERRSGDIDGQYYR